MSNPEIYTWLQTFPGVRIKRNYYRDLSGGVMVAKILHRFHEDLVQLHNYAPANSTENKKENWMLLNARVLTKLSMGLTKKQIDEIALINQEAIDAFLFELKTNVECWGKAPKAKLSPRHISTVGNYSEKPGTAASASSSVSTQNKSDGKKGVNKVTKKVRFSTIVQTAPPSSDTESANAIAHVANDVGSESRDSSYKEINAETEFESKIHSEEIPEEQEETYYESTDIGDCILDTDQAKLEGEIEKWLATMPTISQMIKDINKDFADGILIAKLAAELRPREFENSNYGIANWEILSAKVFPALGISLEQEEIRVRDLMDAKPLAIYKLLLKLKHLTPEDENGPKTQGVAVDDIKEAGQKEKEKGETQNGESKKREFVTETRELEDILREYDILESTYNDIGDQ